MKKVLLSAVAALMIAGAANATLIGLEWRDHAGSTTAPVPAGTPVVARFYFNNGDLGDNPTISGIGIQLKAWTDAAATVPANGVIVQTSVSSAGPLAGWSTAQTVNGEVNGPQFASIFSGNAQTLPDGKSYVMDITLQHNDPNVNTYYLTINRSLSSLFDESGADYMNNDAIWDSRPGYANAYGEGYWAFGNWGGSAWSRVVKKVEVGQTSANPLILVTPEPASLALLALGGFAALRRR